VAWRFLARLSRSPCDAEALVELHDMILADLPSGEGHGEDIADSADPLAVGRLRQVVIAVPARLLRRVSDELEDLLRTG
jgi:hypothetical protein